MTLEDSLGDVLRKARTSTHTAMAAAAAAAGLDVGAYGALEDSGQVATGTRWAELAELLTLDGAKLERLAHGWLPPAMAPETWRELRMITTAGEGMTVNAFLVWDEATRDAALFDTGFDAAPIFALLAEHGLHLRHIFLTHSHGDHVAALGEIRGRCPAARIHTGSKNAPVEQRLTPDACFSVGSLRITHRDTPGHADDGITYVIGNWPEDAPHVAIVGDAIFAGSMGGARDLLPLAREKVRTQILSLPAATLIGPGHGPLTTVALEQANNPWFP